MVALVQPVLDTALAGDGLARTGALRWSGTDCCDPGGELRPTFELVLLKGGAYVPKYGVSLGFVPHLAGGKPAWHRTQKSAHADIWRLATGPKREVNLLDGAAQTEAALARLVATTLPEARAFWGRATGVEALPGLMREAAAEVSEVIAFGHPLGQHRPLVRAFLAARLGDGETARAALSEVGAGADRSAPELSEALEAAIAAQTAPSPAGAPR